MCPCVFLPMRQTLSGGCCTWKNNPVNSRPALKANAPARTDTAGARANSRWQYCSTSADSSTKEESASEVTGFYIGVR